MCELRELARSCYLRKRRKQASAQNPLSVLLIDDEGAYLNSLSVIVRSRGHIARTAASLKEAEKVVSVDPPEILIADANISHEGLPDYLTAQTEQGLISTLVWVRESRRMRRASILNRILILTWHSEEVEKVAVARYSRYMHVVSKSAHDWLDQVTTWLDNAINEIRRNA